MSKSDYLEKRLLDHVLGGVAYVAPATVHLALFTAGNSGEDGVANDTEVSAVGTGYVRLAIANSAAEFPAATGTSPSLKTNANLKLFPEATGDWGTVVAWALMDAGAGGNVLYHGQFAPAQQRTILTGDTATVAAGAIRITED